jgi:tryptophanyl-tRNA synthetase
MSKSAGPNHYIAINDEPDVIQEKLKRAVTGTGTEEILPAGAQNLIALLQEFGTAKQVTYFQDQIKNKSIRYSELKETLATTISDYFADFRAKRNALAKKPQYIDKVLKDGAKKAQKVAQNTMKEVKKLIGVA